MLTKPADMLQLEFRSIRNNPLWENTLLNVVVQCIILSGTFSMHFAGFKSNDTRSDQHPKGETATKDPRRVPGAGAEIEVLVQMQKI